ncbi:ABC transporter ATP-binding protein, partial [Streptomyces diastatochromogenes]
APPGACRGKRYHPPPDWVCPPAPGARRAAGAEKLASRGAAPYLLVTDVDGRPLGWGAPDDLTAGEIDRDRLLPYGRPFVPGTDSLRTALDGAVLSPTGWAVAVDGEGRAVGVVSQQVIGEAIRAAHTAGRPDAKAVR